MDKGSRRAKATSSSHAYLSNYCRLDRLQRAYWRCPRTRNRSFTVATLTASQFGEGSDLFAPLAGLVQTVPAQHPYLLGSSYLDALYSPFRVRYGRTSRAGRYST